MPKERIGDRADLAGLDTGARHLDHGTDRIFDPRSELLGDLANLGGQYFVFAALTDERQHDFGNHAHAFGVQLRRGLEDRADLRLVNLGVADTQARAAMAQHRVELEQAVAHLLR